MASQAPGPPGRPVHDLHKQKSGLGVRSSSRGDAGDHGRAGRMAIAA